MSSSPQSFEMEGGMSKKHSHPSQAPTGRSVVHCRTLNTSPFFDAFDGRMVGVALLDFLELFSLSPLTDRRLSTSVSCAALPALLS